MAEPLRNSKPSNLTPTTFLDLYRELRTAQRDIDSATGIKRGIIKRAKSAGVDLYALSLMDSLSKLEPDDAELRLRNLVRYASWADMKIGMQGDLFGATDDQQPTDKARGEHVEFLADDAGYSAGKRGDSIDTNPHKAGTPTFDRWRQGWHNGQAALAATMKASGKDGEDDADADAPKVARVQSGRRRRGAESRASA